MAACSQGKPGVPWESLAAWLALAIHGQQDTALHPEEHVINKGKQGTELWFPLLLWLTLPVSGWHKDSSVSALCM